MLKILSLFEQKLIGIRRCQPNVVRSTEPTEFRGKAYIDKVQKQGKEII